MFGIFNKRKLSKRITACVAVCIVATLIFIIVYFNIESSLNWDMLMDGYDVASSDVNTNAKSSFMSEFEEYIQKENDDAATSSSSLGDIPLSDQLVGEDKNPYKIPWYTGWTMNHAHNDIDIEAAINAATTEHTGQTGNNYEAGRTRGVVYEPHSAHGWVNGTAYSALWAHIAYKPDKGHGGTEQDLSSQFPTYDKSKYKAIEVKNEATGKLSRLMIVDGRILACVPPRIQYLKISETWNEQDYRDPHKFGVSVNRGNYFDVLLEDGTVLACMMCDAQSIDNEWHYDGLWHGGLNGNGGLLELCVQADFSEGSPTLGKYDCPNPGFLWDNMRVKGVRMYTDCQCLSPDGTFTYYFTEGL